MISNRGKVAVELAVQTAIRENTRRYITDVNDEILRQVRLAIADALKARSVREHEKRALRASVYERLNKVGLGFAIPALHRS